MMIIFGTKTVFQREGQAEQLCCPNCGHVAPQTLCRQLDIVTLFFIPVIRLTKQRGIMCESCGVIRPLSEAEYKEKKRIGRTTP